MSGFNEKKQPHITLQHLLSSERYEREANQILDLHGMPAESEGHIDIDDDWWRRSWCIKRTGNFLRPANAGDFDNLTGEELCDLLDRYENALQEAEAQQAQLREAALTLLREVESERVTMSPDNYAPESPGELQLRKALGLTWE